MNTLQTLEMALEAFETLMSKHDEDIGMDDHADEDCVGYYGNGEEMEMTFGDLRQARKAIAALRQQIALEKQQPSDAPEGYLFRFPTSARWHYTPHPPHDKSKPKLIWKVLYARPQPAAKWVGLTNKEMLEIAGYGPDYFDWKVFARAIEAKLKEKNT